MAFPLNQLDPGSLPQHQSPELEALAEVEQQADCSPARLEVVEALRDMGIVSEAEYASHKAQLIDGESRRTLRRRDQLRITETKHGFVCARSF